MSAKATTVLDGAGDHDVGAPMGHRDRISTCPFGKELTVLCLLRYIAGIRRHPLDDNVAVDSGYDRGEQEVPALCDEVQDHHIPKPGCIRMP